MSVSVLYFPFKGSGMPEPVARVGERIAVYTQGGWRYFEILHVEPLPRYVKDLGSVSAGATSSKTKIDEVEVGDNEVAVVRIRPLEPVRLYVYQPSGRPHYQTKNTSFYIDKAVGRGGQAEIVVYKDDVPYIAVYNPLPIALSKARIEITGFKYRVRPIAAAGVEGVTYLGGEPA